LAEPSDEAGSSTGLAVGTPFPSFSYPDLTGQTINLEDFLDKRVLLVNWSPQCGFCDLIAPDLSKLHARFSLPGRAFPDEHYGLFRHRKIYHEFHD